MPQLTAVVICSLLAVLLASSWTRYRVRMAKLDRIPTVGYSGLLSSYISAYKFIKHGAAIVQEGCTKYRGAAFKVPLMDKWIVIISNADMVEDFYRASEAQLSLQEAFRETFHADLVLGKQPGQDPYHVGVIQGTLTRNLGAKFPEIYDEMLAAFNDEVPPTDDWVQVATTQKVLNIVCRMSNRVFVNLPLCRNEEWRAIVLDYATKVFTASQTINLFPKFLQPAVGWWINPRPASYRHAVKYLEPIILDRLQKEKQQGVDWDAPEDLLTWLLKSATVNEKERRDPANLILSILTVNMGAIHTTSMAFTNAIFNLALRPELIDILRREIEPIVKEDGWTKNAMGKMRILDSFLKESQRYSSSFSISVQRKPLENFTFSNGTVVPAGTIIVASPRAIHFDENHYPNPSEFDAFRSYRMNEKSGNMKHQMATPETNYLAFGIGKHACPGRVFAVTELKLLVSHLLLNYDIMFGKQDDKPGRNEFGGRLNLDEKTKVMFRRRVVQ
ncbi:cytochrome p450 [Moniliophthora roreri MCA 2997]|uniref:Cytochrome p450 n=1 Tax=Moniliophthora roreri (strain MCA 2997) TaxID=1381753 RepID=V2YX07_MONRO|nr:cytochrome p450 [Moniliophthora roreri MCA 2997]